MHAIKTFTCNPLQERVAKMEREINDWLKHAETKFSALVVHRTNIVCGDTIVIFTFYYSYLPNDAKKENPAQAGPGEDNSAANPSRSR